MKFGAKGMFFFCLIHPEDGDLNVRRNIRII
jgi:hypothetical protein